jgi:hypothetical protein
MTAELVRCGGGPWAGNNPRLASRKQSDLSASSLILESLKSGRLFGYLARRPGNRASTARCPRGRAGTRRVQVVDARGRRCQEWREMAERKLNDGPRSGPRRGRTDGKAFHE